MYVDTIIVNTKLVFPTEIIEAGLAINEGKIVAISKDHALPKADVTINAEGNLLMPGIIDAHVHLTRDASTVGGEDLASGTAAAAVGGVTIVGLMPAEKVLTENKDSFRYNKSRVEGSSLIDFSMLGAFSGGEGKDFSKFIPELWDEGAIAIKGYMHNHRPGRWIKASYDGEMLWALEQIAKVGAIANVHCENEYMQTWNREQIMKGNKRDAEAYLKYSPPIVEYEAGKRFLYLCKVAGARGLMVHTSLPELVMESVKGKREGYQLFVETCPHYLYFSEDDLREKGIRFKCAPTLRDKDRVYKMWEMLDNGFIDTISSDHVSSHKSILEEAEKRGDLFAIGAGMPHIEYTLTSLMNGVNKGLSNIFSVVKALTENPAKIYGLYPKKGVLQIGSDADLVLVDMNQEKKVDKDNIISKAGWSSFEGMTLKGVPTMTMVRGQIISEDGEIVGDSSYGKFVPRIEAKIEAY